jgi:acyl-coenzyme A thioesterase PaaI-like protein
MRMSKHKDPFQGHPLLSQWSQNKDFDLIRNDSPEERKKLGFIGYPYTSYQPKFHTIYFWNRKDSKLYGLIYFGKKSEGPKGCAHGGAIATIFDEMFGKAVRCSGVMAVTGNLNVNFRKFIPLQEIKKVEAKLDRIEGRKIFVSGQITDPSDSILHAEATGLFIQFDWQRMEKPN